MALIDLFKQVPEGAENLPGKIYEILDFTRFSPGQDPELVLHYRIQYHSDGRITKEILFKRDFNPVHPQRGTG